MRSVINLLPVVLDCLSWHGLTRVQMQSNFYHPDASCHQQATLSRLWHPFTPSTRRPRVSLAGKPLEPVSLSSIVIHTIVLLLLLHIIPLCDAQYPTGVHHSCVGVADEQLVRWQMVFEALWSPVLRIIWHMGAPGGRDQPQTQDVLMAFDDNWWQRHCLEVVLDVIWPPTHCLWFSASFDAGADYQRVLCQQSPQSSR